MGVSSHLNSPFSLGFIEVMLILAIPDLFNMMLRWLPLPYPKFGLELDEECLSRLRVFGDDDDDGDDDDEETISAAIFVKKGS